MLNRMCAAAAALSALLMLAAPTANAQDDPSAVVVTVNGTEITRRDLALGAETYIVQLQRMPAQLRLPWLVDRMIDQVLLAGVGKDEGVEQSDAYLERIDHFTREALRDAYVESVVNESITEADIEARYEKEIAELPEEEQAVARHILVETEEEAREIAEEARGGADFAELARERSTGPSAEEGGKLDPFTADDMVPEFSSAAFAMEPGDISDPVKSQFGWHVIKLEEKRLKPPPSLEEIRDNVKVMILRDRVQTKAQELRDGATIVYAGEAESPAPPEDGASAPEGDGAGTPLAQ